MKKFIFLGNNCGKSYLIFVSAALAIFDAIINYVFKLQPPSPTNRTSIYLFNYLLTISLSRFFFGFILSMFSLSKFKRRKSIILFSYSMDKSEEVSEISKQKKISLTYTNIRSIIYIFILTVLDYIGNFIYFFFSNMNTNLSSKISQIFNILSFVNSFFICIYICYKLFNFRLYRHHKVSIAILIIGIVLVILSEIIYKTFQFDLIVCAFIFLRAILYILYDVGVKYLMEFKFIDFNLVYCIDGIFSTLLTFGIFMVSRFIKCNNFLFEKSLCEKENYIFYFSQLNYPFKNLQNFLPFLCFFLYIGIFGLLVILIVKNFSPLHFVISDIISFVLIKVWLRIIYRVPLDAISVVGYSMIFLSSILFNELIIFNVCGLQQDTVLFIKKRASEDSVDIHDLNFSNILQNNNDTMTVKTELQEIL